MIDAKIFSEEKGDVCPANWDSTKDGMSATRDGVAEEERKVCKYTACTAEEATPRDAHQPAFAHNDENESEDILMLVMPVMLNR